MQCFDLEKWQECMADSKASVGLFGIDEVGRGPLAGPVVAASRITSYNVCYTKLLRTNLDERDVKGRFSSQSITTTPPIAPYSTEPDTPTQPAGEIGLTSLDINFELDVTSGYFSKVRVRNNFV